MKQQATNPPSVSKSSVEAGVAVVTVVDDGVIGPVQMASRLMVSPVVQIALHETDPLKGRYGKGRNRSPSFSLDAVFVL